MSDAELAETGHYAWHWYWLLLAIYVATTNQIHRWSHTYFGLPRVADLLQVHTVVVVKRNWQFQTLMDSIAFLWSWLHKYVVTRKAPLWVPKVFCEYCWKFENPFRFFIMICSRRIGTWCCPYSTHLSFRTITGNCFILALPSDPAPSTSSRPPYGSPRLLLLHHRGLAELPAGQATLLATVRARHYGGDGRTTPVRRHEVEYETRLIDELLFTMCIQRFFRCLKHVRWEIAVILRFVLPCVILWKVKWKLKVRIRLRWDACLLDFAVLSVPLLWNFHFCFLRTRSILRL